MPLLDVVFLLLTFFIFSYTVMIRADAVSVGLAPVGGGSQAAAAGAIRLLVIGAEGELTYDGQPLAAADLDGALQNLAADAESPTLYVSLAEAGTADRGPVVWDLLQRVDRAGVRDVVFVGPPTEAAAETPVGSGENVGPGGARP